MDAIVAGATGIMASPYLLGAAAAIPFHSVAPGTVAGNFVGDAAGMIAIDETSKALTGRTTGQHIGDALGLAEDSNWRYAVDFANPINIMGLVYYVRKFHLELIMQRMLPIHIKFLIP